MIMEGKGRGDPLLRITSTSQEAGLHLSRFQAVNFARLGPEKENWACPWQDDGHSLRWKDPGGPISTNLQILPHIDGPKGRPTSWRFLGFDGM